MRLRFHGLIGKLDDSWMNKEGMFGCGVILLVRHSYGGKHREGGLRFYCELGGGS